MGNQQFRFRKNMPGSRSPQNADRADCRLQTADRADRADRAD